jgi:hypothetical protein
MFYSRFDFTSLKHCVHILNKSFHIFTTALAATSIAVCSDGFSRYQTGRYHFSLSVTDVMTVIVIEQVK